MAPDGWEFFRGVIVEAALTHKVRRRPNCDKLGNDDWETIVTHVFL